MTVAACVMINPAVASGTTTHQLFHAVAEIKA
jgi:hypothetical protein